MAERAAQITYPMSILDDRDRNELFGRIAGVETELKDSIADLDEKVETYKTEHEQDVEDINQNIVDNVETLNETIVNTQTLLQQNIDSNTADIEDNTNRIYANEKNIAEIEKTISTGAGMGLDYEDSQLSLLASDNGGEHHEFRTLRKLKYLFDYLVGGLTAYLLTAHGTVRHTHSCVKQTEVIVYLGYRTDGASWVLRGSLLVDGDSGGKSLYAVDLRLVHLS